MSYFKVHKYNENLYQLQDALGVLVTLVIGKEKALLLDTAYGIGNLKEAVESLTTKPLIVINSHGHMDHCCGNYQFPKVYINEKDFNLCKEHNGVFRRKKNIEAAKKNNCLPNDFDEQKYLHESYGNIELINVDEEIDLGDISLKVIAMPGHTQGSIGLYIKEWRLLLVSDATCPFVWLFLEESTTVSEYVEMLKGILQLDFENFLVGHGARMFPKSKMNDFYDVAKNIDLEKSVKVSFPNFENLNSYCYTTGVMYNQNDCGIVFDPNKL